MSVPANPSPTPQPGTPAKKKGLRMDLVCPKCGMPAWLDWQQLPYLLCCPRCTNSIWIDRGGHLQSEHEMGSVAVECPRCHEARRWPKGVPLKQIRCQSCDMDIRLENVNSTPSAAPRTPGGPAEKGAKAKKAESEAKPLSPLAIAGMVVLAVVVCVFAGIALMRSVGADEALAAAVEGFTAASVAGEVEKAKAWVAPEQQTPFGTWVVQNPGIGSLVQWGKPEIRIVEYSAAAARARVVIHRSAQDTQVQMQSWRRAPGGPWQFDAAETLKRGE
jgi:hypothetical protein